MIAINKAAVVTLSQISSGSSDFLLIAILLLFTTEDKTTDRSNNGSNTNYNIISIRFPFQLYYIFLSLENFWANSFAGLIVDLFDIVPDVFYTVTN